MNEIPGPSAEEIVVSPESNEGEPTVLNLVEACREELPQEYLDELNECGDIDEALGLVFTMLIENGVDDPDTFLQGRGITQPV